jgi:transketolase
MYEDLEEKAAELRRKTFEAFVAQGEAHLGGSFSIIEALIGLYEEILRPEDKFILSKAHASFPLCILLRERGYRPPLTTHLEIDPDNGIYCTTGSLGHGLPIATGMAIARKRRNKQGKIYVMISDGECQEGTTWESLLIAAKHQLDNLVVLVDFNKIQALTSLEDALPLDSLPAKFQAFNWECKEVFNGHSFPEIIEQCRLGGMSGRPSAIILHTIKGKGIAAFENDPGWHARKIKGKDLEIGRRELGIN